MLKSNIINSNSQLLCIFIMVSFAMKAQHQISKYEYRWALIHPFTALNIKKKLPKAMAIYKDVKQRKLLDTIENGGKLDAFRHIYSMAYLSRSINVKKLRNLGKAHEKGNKLLYVKQKLEFGERADSLLCEMDLLNNELGFVIGSNNKQLNDQELKEIVINEIQTGKAWYLKRNPKAQYIDCDGNVLILENFKDKWHIPKCLIKTNE